MYASFYKMAGSLKLLILLCLLVFVFSKDLHTKQTLEFKDKDAKGFMNLFNNQDFTKNERFARHIKTVTESVLDHLIKEIRHQYFNANYNANSPIPRLIRNLNKEMKRNEQSKLQKEKEKRKNTNKKRNMLGKKKLKLTTLKST